MDEIRYIHAADLHLDAPFYNLAKGDAALAERVQGATFKALDRLTQLCVARKPDFLLLAGDIVHQDGVRARLRLRDACVTLNKAGIPVFMVHGNHDPASARLSAISWPENTVIFGVNGGTHVLEKDGVPLALIHGASHAQPQESRNLASLLHRDPGFAGFQIGLLHCNVDGAVAADRYAPCSLKDLLATGLDAWALGHAHTRQILSQAPFIAYAGNSQGLHVNETGARGCFLVTARRKDDAWACEAQFHELDTARWQREVVNMDAIKTLDDLDGEINRLLLQAANYAGSAETVILSLEFKGRTELHSQLTKMDLMAEFGREPIYENGRDVWLSRIKLATAPQVAPVDNLERDDLLGEISRIARSLEQDETLLAATMKRALAPVANACRENLKPPTGDASQELLQRAMRICQDMLEGR